MAKNRLSAPLLKGIYVENVQFFRLPGTYLPLIPPTPAQQIFRRQMYEITPPPFPLLAKSTVRIWYEVEFCFNVLIEAQAKAYCLLETNIKKTRIMASQKGSFIAFS